MKKMIIIALAITTIAIGATVASAERCHNITYCGAYSDVCTLEDCPHNGIYHCDGTGIYSGTRYGISQRGHRGGCGRNIGYCHR